jgi:hypothetical protein
MRGWVALAPPASPPLQEGTPTLLSESHGELCLAIPEASRNPEFRELSAAMAVRVPRIGVEWDEQYFVVLDGRLSGLGRYGHDGLCSREFVVRNVVALRPMTGEERYAQCILRRPSCLQSIPESDAHFCDCVPPEPPTVPAPAEETN